MGYARSTRAASCWREPALRCSFCRLQGALSRAQSQHARPARPSRLVSRAVGRTHNRSRIVRRNPPTQECPMNSKRRLSLAFLPLALLATVSVPASAQSPPAPAAANGLAINIGYFPVVSPVPIMRSQRQLEAKGYVVTWVPISQGLPGAASALAAGQLDMTWGNSVSAVVILSQSPAAAQFVGQSFINANVTVVADKSSIQSAKDIVGKKVVVSGMKTASTLFFQIGLKK